MSPITVVGSVNLDLVATAPQLPRPGETVLGHGFATVPGGKGANQAVAAARAGGRCSFIGAVGDDRFGGQLRETLVAAEVDVTGLRTVPGPSGMALIVVDDAGENSIVVVPGANATVTALTGRDRGAVIGAQVLVCQLEIPLSAVAEAAAVARSAGTVVVLNAAPARSLPPELLANVDLLVVNETEAAAVAGQPGPPQKLAEALLAQVPRVVLTLGARGAGYVDRAGGWLEVPAPRVDAVDTTGAGDAFTGALAVAWAEHRRVEEALRWACAAGAACARRPGAATAVATRAEIDELYRAAR